MEAIDAELQDSNIAIHARPTHALLKFTETFNIQEDVPITVDDNPPLLFTPKYISAHINNWFAQRYGERLKIHPGPGIIAILIKGQPWKVQLPCIFGTVELICDRNLSTPQNDISQPAPNTIPTYNVLLAIENLQESLAKDLTDLELHNILVQFKTGLDSLNLLADLNHESMIKEAKIDLSNAVSNLVAPIPHYGMSKYASLQFTEKIIKSKFRQAGSRFPYVHDLTELANIAKEKGICDINAEKISKIQCTAGARYGDENVTLLEAMEAHTMSLLLINEVTIG